ncbi:unnamed protein product [Pleuronectes platessa]|uniref:Uncharacterized protein n=1 Tax=Pleuronectes platessa TaxID=8262 RepID=A0A9N7Z284_PLEPL|nr:unnamed protein product [Pleuronectes platessa]
MGGGAPGIVTDPVTWVINLPIKWLQRRTGAQEVVIRCPLNHIQCTGTKKCIHFNKLCNGARDCEDGYDEGVHCRERQTDVLSSHFPTSAVDPGAKVTPPPPSCQSGPEEQQAGSTSNYIKLLYEHLACLIRQHLPRDGRGPGPTLAPSGIRPSSPGGAQEDKRI